MIRRKMEGMQSVVDLIETKLEDQVHSEQFMQSVYMDARTHLANLTLLLKYKAVRVTILGIFNLN